MVMSTVEADEDEVALVGPYYCKRCRKPIDLASDFESFRASDLSSIIGYDYKSEPASSVSSSNTSSLDHRLQVNAFLSDIINGRAENNHPMCQECADTLISAQQQLIEFQKEEIARLEHFFAQLKSSTSETANAHSAPADSANRMFLIPTHSKQETSSTTSSTNDDLKGPQTSLTISSADKSISVCHTYEKHPDPSVDANDTKKVTKEAEGKTSTSKAQLLSAQEELLSLNQELTRLQQESRLLDKQITINEDVLRVRQIEVDRLNNEYNEKRLVLIEAEETLSVLEARFNDARYQYERLRRTNVLNAAFPIWYDGHIGVINGLHLGRLPSKPITWPEINGALGQCAMLATCLAKKLSYTFQNYVIIPMGNQSKIAAVPNGTPMPLYNSAGSMRIFSSASFDNALVMFLDCVGQLQEQVERPPNFCLPFTILENGRIRDRSGSVLSIKCSTSTDENWTKALKMLIIDLKYIIAATFATSAQHTSKTK